MIFKSGKTLSYSLQRSNIPSNQLHFGLVILFLSSIWIFDYFPSQDGPTHISNALAFLEYFNPEYNVFREYYVINYSLTPTWFTHLILASLLSFLSPTIAEKVFLSSYIILFPIAVLYALHSINPNTSFLSFLTYPFIFNLLLHLGFYSFCFSLIMFFFVIGFWIRHQDRFSQRDTIIFTILSLLLYLFHISVWSWTFFGITILVVWLTLLDFIHQQKSGNINWHILWTSFKIRALIPFYACLPTLLLIAAFLVDKQFATIDSDIPYIERFVKLLSLYSLVSFDLIEIFPSILLSLLFGLISSHLFITKLQYRKIIQWDGLLLIFIAYSILYMISPETILITPNRMQGGGYIDQRLNLFPFFALLLWFATQEYSTSLKKRIQYTAIVISVSMLIMHMYKYAEFNEYIADYLSGMEEVELNSTVLGLSFSSLGPPKNGTTPSKRVELFTHTVDYIAAQRYSVSFTNYEANHGYFPLIYRPELNPYNHLAQNDVDIEIPLEAELELQNYTQHTKGKLDYILLWGLEEEHLKNEKVKSILIQLENGYELIYRSPLKLMTLYKVKSQYK